MVNSETLFSRLLSLDTLLAFDGIIPSLAEFQLKLTTLIKKFGKELISENSSQEESEILCRIICLYFDKRITASQHNNPASWQRYSLVHYFYGYGDTEQSLIGQLEALIDTQSETIFQYVWKILTLLMQIEGQNDMLSALHAAGHARYFSGAPSHPLAQETELAPPTEKARNPDEYPRLMVFIIGPFASKWFSQVDLSVSESIVWVITPSVTALSRRIAHLQDNNSVMDTQAFFPILADGLESCATLKEQLADWRYALACGKLQQRLSCMVAFYTRLSQERLHHDPDQAIWTGQLTTQTAPCMHMESWINHLMTALKAKDDGQDLYAIQRHAMGRTLVQWLGENHITQELQNLFDTTPLELTGIAFADHGNGFTRHGAWSLWLAEKYGILPSLSASIALPPLPVIHQTPGDPPVICAPVITPSRTSHRRWWPTVMAIIAPLLLLIAIAAAYYTRTPSTQASIPMSSDLPSVDETATALLTLSSTAPLFKNGSSDLAPGSQQTLENIATEIMYLPRQHFLIIGHSDSTGTDEINLKLSMERARVIRDWLITRTDLPENRFIIKGAGNSQPIASNDTQRGRAMNRRVEIIPLSTQGNNH